MDDLGEEFAANIVRVTLKNSLDTQCEANLTDRLSKDNNEGSSADEFYQHQPLTDATHRNSGNSRRERQRVKHDLKRVSNWFNLKIKAIGDAYGLDTDDLKTSILKVKLDMWIFAGVCRYRLCWQRLDKVAKQFAKAGTLPHGYQYPELHNQKEMPNELSQALKRKNEHVEGKRDV